MADEDPELTSGDIDGLRDAVRSAGLPKFEFLGSDAEHNVYRFSRTYEWTREWTRAWFENPPSVDDIRAAIARLAREGAPQSVVVARPDHPNLGWLRAHANVLRYRLVEHGAAPVPPEVYLLDLGYIEKLHVHALETLRREMERPPTMRGQRPQFVVLDELAEFDFSRPVLGDDQHERIDAWLNDWYRRVMEPPSHHGPDPDAPNP